MPFDIIAAAENALRGLDWATFLRWDLVSPVLDSIIPEAISDYRP
ncbi:hypothetical protein [Corynebacterium sp. AOP12-C2-36]